MIKGKLSGFIMWEVNNYVLEEDSISWHDCSYNSAHNSIPTHIGYEPTYISRVLVLAVKLFLSFGCRMDKLEIDKAVLKKTTRCKYDFSCLSGDHSCMCEVIELKGISSIKIRPNPYTPCSYDLPFHQSHYCVCPTRREIFVKYKI